MAWVPCTGVGGYGETCGAAGGSDNTRVSLVIPCVCQDAEGWATPSLTISCGSSAWRVPPSPTEDANLALTCSPADVAECWDTLGERGGLSSALHQNGNLRRPTSCAWKGAPRCRAAGTGWEKDACWGRCEPSPGLCCLPSVSSLPWRPPATHWFHQCHRLRQLQVSHPRHGDCGLDASAKGALNPLFLFQYSGAHPGHGIMAQAHTLKVTASPSVAGPSRDSSITVDLPHHGVPAPQSAQGLGLSREQEGRP